MCSSDCASISRHVSPHTVFNRELIRQQASFYPPGSDGGDSVTAFVITWDVSESFNSLVGSPHSGSARVNSSERAYTVQYLSTSRRSVKKKNTFSELLHWNPGQEGNMQSTDIRHRRRGTGVRRVSGVCKMK